MCKYYILRVVFAGLAFTSFNADAMLVNEDWNGGANLITRDTVTGLGWLDLTETNNLSRDYVLTQLESGGLFEGFRYATSAEVVELWSNYGIDLSDGAPLSSGTLDPNIITASNQLGNIWNEYNSSNYPYGTAGVTSDQHPTDSTQYEWLGAYQTTSSGSYYRTDNNYFYTTSEQYAFLGHYLVTTPVTPVPVPPAFWLLCSGLLCLVGVANRKPV